MAQSTTNREGRHVGDYVVGNQIGSGSFSVVWHARHEVHGTEVAIKEIVTGQLNKKLHDYLMSEIVILKQINHPNIIRLHDIIEETGRIHIVLEYCRGGDLSMYIQERQRRVPEASAKHLMQQLATGLKVLRDNSLIHRDLKPQNLLLSTNDDNAVLKIADFGFARSLQPRGLAETLCGSPLYMAPEIMQVQKYDAKADLWSVGAILYQLVTGKPPFTGNNQIQLLQNIMKSSELCFPPDKMDLSADCMDLCRKLLRRNPVERLTFEEFFNHPFLTQRHPDELLRNMIFPRIIDGFCFSECNHERNAEDSSQEDCLPFSLDDDLSVPDGSSSFFRMPSINSTYRFSLDTTVDRKEAPKISKTDPTFKYGGVTHKTEKIGFGLGSCRTSEGNLKGSFKSTDQRPISISARGASNLIESPCNLESFHQVSANGNTKLSAPVPIIGVTGSRVGCTGSLDSHSSSAPFDTSPGSVDVGDALEQPPTHSLARIKSLQRFASTISELVDEKFDAGRHLEAFSIKLVSLSIWKQALHICHTRAVSGSPTQEMATFRGSAYWERDNVDVTYSEGLLDICSQIEREFLLAVGNAEELARVIEPGNMEMPDAMETIYQSALALGRRGAVDEYMGDAEIASVHYSKAVRLLVFLLVEAPSLILNPPFSLTNSDRYRLRCYIDVLDNRQSHSRSQRMALLKCEDQQSPF